MESVPLKPGDVGQKKSSSNSILAPPEESSAVAEDNHGKLKAKTSPYLDVPLQSVFNRSSNTVLDLSLYPADNENERRTGRLPTPSGIYRLPSISPGPPPTTRKGNFNFFWLKNKGLVLVMLAQLFGVMMNVATRLLEMDGSDGAGMHPFQILFARMTGTLCLSCTYQWLAKVEHAPFGPPEVRKLLIFRGVGGFFGVYGLYYSLQYLPLSDATVITFLAPIVACWACSILIHEPFTRTEQIAAVISFLGVVLIARPTSLLSSYNHPPLVGSGAGDGVPPINATAPLDLQGLKDVTSAQRLSAVAVALIGVLGAACAYTTIRWIGKRAHPLISVNYFAAFSTIVSIVALLAIPGIGFRLPASLQQWAYLLFLGICGFVMQFLLTAGLAHEKSSRATNMVYTQMLFALAFDKIVWGTVPGTLSIVGSSLILGSALYVAVLNNKKIDGKGRDGTLDEEVELGGACGDEDSDRGVQEVQLRTLRV